MDCWLLRPLVGVLAFLVLAGCGLVVPDIKEIWDKDIPAPDPNVPKVTGAAQIEYEIEEKIFCELREGVQEAQHYYVIKYGTARKGLFPPNWGAQVALSLEVDETSALTPGVTFNQVLPNAVNVFGPGAAGTVTSAQSFGLGLGGSFSSTSTRTDKFNPYWSIGPSPTDPRAPYLMKPIDSDSACHRRNDPFVRQGKTPASSSPFIIESELGIKDWVVGAMFVDDIIPSTPQGQGGGQGGGPKPESISIELKFVIVTSGNVTPTWKLVRLSNSGSSPFFNTGRTRTHDLIITIGPNNQQTNNSHLAAQIGTAVGNANRSVFTSPPLISSP
jgi:hypothetical protein